MIKSMTGFAAISRDGPEGALTLELRSVNHRYLEVLFRVPEDLRVLESSLREAVAGRVSRGKVDLRITWTPRFADKAPEINPTLLAQVNDLARQVREVLPEARGLSVSDVLRWPGMLGTEDLPLEGLRERLNAMMKQALDDLDATRAREGDKLKALISERLDAVEAQVALVLPLLPQVVAAYQEKLTARLMEVLGSADEDRIRQEVTVFASKVDVDEELTRLRAHVSEVRRVLGKGGQAGKRLDFLMQELNREANTLGSKSAATDVSRASMELKVLIEQMREQIQNIE